MSSHSDDPARIAAPFVQPAAASEVLYSLDDGMLERYLSGTLRPDETDAVTQFLSDPIRARALHSFQLWAEQVPDAQPSEKTKKLAKLWGKICDQETPGTSSFAAAAKRAEKADGTLNQLTHSKPALGKRTLLTAWQKDGVFSGQILPLRTRIPLSAKWLAGGLLAMLLGSFMMRTVVPSRTEMTRTYETHVGQQATFTLGDGTRVTLAPQTSLTLTRFGAHSRTVGLSGEAYFDVAQSSGVPFIVQTSRVTTRVLGTTFLVRSYDEDAHVQVVVTNGKVHLEGTTLPSAGVTLTRGQVAMLVDSTVKVGTSDEATSETGWMSGNLNFIKTPLPEVLATLSRWYGYQFRLSDSTLNHERITAALSTRSSTAALANLKQLLNVNLTVVGDTVILTPQVERPASGTHRVRSYDIWTPTREVGR